MGAINFIVQMVTPDVIASMSDTHRAIIEGRPAWATVGFGVAVFGGALGCLVLLFRKSASYHFFIASGVGVVVAVIHTVRIARSNVLFHPSDIFMMMVMPVLVAALLIWYANYSKTKGWIR